jgi:hypothetical protein
MIVNHNTILDEGITGKTTAAKVAHSVHIVV